MVKAKLNNMMLFCVPVEHYDTVYFDTDSFLDLIFLKGAFMSLYITLN